MTKTNEKVLTLPSGAQALIAVKRTSVGWRLSYSYLCDGVPGLMRAFGRCYETKAEAWKDAARAFVA